MKVLVATDGSDAALDAAKRAVTLLRAGAEIALVTVIPGYEDPMETAGGIEGPDVTEEEAEEEYEHAIADGRAALDRTSAALHADADVRLVPAEDDPGHALVNLANDEHPDLIVIGSGGKSFFKRLFTGSTSDYVIHHAPCPVLVIRHDH
jgi:nucleotide-binding universal stress UspA family protein